MADRLPEFLLRLQADDGEAWTEAFEELYRIAWHASGSARWTLSAEDREEVACEAAAEVAAQIKQLSQWSQVTALVFVIARRRAVSHLRAKLAQKRRSADGPDQELGSVPESDLPEADSRSLQKWCELNATLQHLLAALGEPAGALIRGYTLEGLTYEELAARHGMPVGTVGVTIYRTLHKLKRQLATTPKLLEELSLYLRMIM